MFTDFGVALLIDMNALSPKIKHEITRSKISIANTMKKHQPSAKYQMDLEEYQNKENENPQKDEKVSNREEQSLEPDEDVVYAQVNVRLESEGPLRVYETDRDTKAPANMCTDDDKLYGYSNYAKFSNDPNYIYSVPKRVISNESTYRTEKRNPENAEELYAAINKSGPRKKAKFPVPDETWSVADLKKDIHLHKVIIRDDQCR